MPRWTQHPGRGAVALVFTALVLAVSVRAQTPASTETWTTTSQQWYVLSLQGTRVGAMHELIESSDAALRTTTVTEMAVGRGAQQTRVRIETRFTEGRDGSPVELRTIQTMSNEAVETVYEFEADHVTQTTRQAGREQATRRPLPPGVWLTPRAAHRYIEQRRAADAASITYRTLDGQAGLLPSVHTLTRVGTERFTHDGREIPVTTWTTRIEPAGLDGSLTLSSDGTIVRSTLTTGLGPLEMTLSTEADARRAPDPDADLFARTFVRVEPIRGHLRTTRGRFRLSTPDGSLPSLPNAGAQAVSEDSGLAGTLVVVDVNRREPAPDAEQQDRAYLRASRLVDSEDAQIQALAARAVRDAGVTPHARAEAMRRFVHRYITRKDLATAFASASETAARRSGDCSEHAVLLCAMLRADGIPARVANGLIYVDRMGRERHVFAWHMWTQALIDGCWVDFDATLAQRFHAAHVLISTSSLEHDAGADLTALLGLMGKLEIEVRSVEHARAGQPIR